jgi:hypothetical protein
VLGPRCFQGCDGLSVVHFECGTRLAEIQMESFTASALSGICVPGTVRSLAVRSFACCVKLRSVFFECQSGVSVIEDEAFAGAVISSFDLPPSIEHVSESALPYVTLSSITAKENPNYRCGDSFLQNADVLFGYFGRLEQVGIPREVVRIADHCFERSATLRKVVFSRTCKLIAIGSHSFHGCQISSMFIPKSVVTLGENCFAECRRL